MEYYPGHQSNVSSITDNANRMVYHRLEQWLIRAFNGEFLKLDGLRPIKDVILPDS